MYSDPAGQKTGSVRKQMPSMLMTAVAVVMWVTETEPWKGAILGLGWERDSLCCLG